MGSACVFLGIALCLFVFECAKKSDGDSDTYIWMHCIKVERTSKRTTGQPRGCAVSMRS
jgi:hypothetical protein